MNPRELWPELDANIVELEKRIEMLERTLAGMQVLLGKASEYKARPKKERLPR